MVLYSKPCSYNSNNKINTNEEIKRINTASRKPKYKFFQKVNCQPFDFYIDVLKKIFQNHAKEMQVADFMKGSKKKNLVYICHYGAPAIEQNKVSNAKGI